MPVGTVGPEGLELPQQLADAVVGPGREGGDHHGDHERERRRIVVIVVMVLYL